MVGCMLMQIPQVTWLMASTQIRELLTLLQCRGEEGCLGFDELNAALYQDGILLT